MSESVETLELRKQVLLARSSLCRLRIAYEVTNVRESMRWPRIGLDAFELIIGRGRLAQVLRGAAFALALAKLARSAAAYFSAP